MARPWPGTIRGLATLCAAATAMVTGLLGLATYGVVHEEIEKQIDHRIEVETQTLLDLHRENGFDALAKVIRIRDHGGLPGTTGYLDGIDEEDRSMGYILLDAHGARRAGTLDAAMPPPGWSEFVAFRRPDGSTAIAQAMNSAVPGGGRLLVAADRSIVDQMDVKILKLFVAGFGLLSLIGAIAAIGFGRIVRRRMLGMEASARAIMAGRFDRRMPLDGSDGEFDRLAIVLNQMLDRIGALMANLNQVSGDIAHDLRTPLHRLRNRLEEAESAKADDRDALIAAALRDSDDLLELFSGLLALAEIEGRAVRSRFAEIDLAALVGDTADAYRPAFEQAGTALSIALDPARIHGDRQLLQRCLANLLDNVIAHARAGAADVTLAADGDRARICVADDGRGIAASEHQRIFQRLARLDPSRSRPGHGLGLSIVAAIVAAHDGAVRVLDDRGGFAIEITLPISTG